MDTISFLNQMSSRFVQFSGAMLVQSCVLILILLALTLLLRRRAKAVFLYALWMLLLVKLVLPVGLALPSSPTYWARQHLPEITLFETPLTSSDRAISNPPTVSTNTPVPLPPAVAPRPAVTRTKQVTTLDTTASQPPVNSSANVTHAQSETPISWQAFAMLAWLTTVCVMMGLLVQRAFFVNSLIRQSRPADETLLLQLKRCATDMNMRHRVDLKLSPNATSPSVCGLLRPVILIPDNLTGDLNPGQTKAVLIHELAHIKRGDLWVNLVQALLQILYFYNPLLWVANSIIRRIREQAVDEMVLVVMNDHAKDYPDTLLTVSKLVWSKPMLSLRLIGVVESKYALSGRINHILSRPFPKSAKLGLAGFAAILISATVLLPMAKGESEEGLSTVKKDLFGITDALAVSDRSGNLTVHSIRVTGLDGRTWSSNETSIDVEVTNHSDREVNLGLRYYADSGTVAVFFSPGASSATKVLKVRPHWQGLLEFPIRYQRFANGGYVKVTLAKCPSGHFEDDATEVFHEKQYTVMSASQRKQAVRLLHTLKTAKGPQRLRAAEKLARYGRSVVPPIMEMLQDNNVWAAHALRLIGSEAEDAVPALIQSLTQGGVGGVRSFSATALGQIGPAAVQAIPALIKALEDERWNTRELAADALGYLSKGDDDTMEALTATLKDENQRVRKAASASLNRIERAVSAIAAKQADQANEKTLSPLSKEEMAKVDFFAAVRHGNLAKVKQFISQGFDINTTDGKWNKQTALHMAGPWGKTDVAELLVKAGADIDPKDSTGKTPLTCAASYSYQAEPTAKLLIDHGADVTVSDDKGMTPLHHACTRSMSEMLLEKGANIHARDNRGWTPLHYDSNWGRISAVEYLLEKGSNIEARDDEGRTPIMLASTNGYGTVVDLLLNHGASISALDNLGRTTLHWAVIKDKNEIIQLLNGQAANGGRSQAAIDKHYDKIADTVKRLMAGGSDPKVQDSENLTALDYAKAASNETAAMMLAADHESKHPEYGARLPNGVAVELLGVCEHPSTGKSWWSPDGTLLDFPPYRELNDREAYSDLPLYEIVYRVNPSDSSISKINKTNDIPGCFGPYPISRETEGVSENLQDAVYAYIPVQGTDDQVDLSFACGTENGWQMLLRADSPVDRSGMNSDDANIYVSIGENKRIIAHVTHKLSVEVRVVAKDHDGLLHHPISIKGKGMEFASVLSAEFDLSVDQTAKVEVQVQDFQPITFKNVSLSPNHKTNVQIEAEKTVDHNADWKALTLPDIDGSKVTAIEPLSVSMYWGTWKLLKIKGVEPPAMIRSVRISPDGKVTFTLDVPDSPEDVVNATSYAYEDGRLVLEGSRNSIIYRSGDQLIWPVESTQYIFHRTDIADRNIPLGPRVKTDPLDVQIEAENATGGQTKSKNGIQSTSAEAAFIIQKVRDRYAAMKTYSAMGELLMSIERLSPSVPTRAMNRVQPKGTQELKSLFAMKMARPNLYCFEWSENIETGISSVGNAWSVGHGSFGLIHGKEQSYEKPLRALIATASQLGRAQSCVFFEYIE